MVVDFRGAARDAVGPRAINANWCCGWRDEHGIDVHRVALADPIRAIPAVLRSVLLRRAREFVAIFSTSEPPRRIHPLMRKRGRPFYRFTLCKVRDRIVALDRDSASVFVDGIHL